jgi:hypothetical protein
VRTLLAHRDARFYLAGQVLSTVGDNAPWSARACTGPRPTCLAGSTRRSRSPSPCRRRPRSPSIALGAALVAVVDYRLLLAVMAAVLVISVVYLMGGPGAVAPAVAPVPVRDGRA